MSTLNINNTDNQVTAINANQNIIITDNGNISQTSITVTQPVTSVVLVNTPGPQGPSGGGGGNINTSSLATTGSNTFIGNQNIIGDIIITGSDYVNSAIKFVSGASITTTGVNLDITAGPGGWSELGSNNGQNYVWVDDSGLYMVTSWDSNVQTSAWRINTGSRELTAVGNLNMNGFTITGSLNGTASWASQSLTASYTPAYVLNSTTSSMNVSSSLTSSFLTPGTYLITSSWAQSSSQALTSSYAITSSQLRAGLIGQGNFGINPLTGNYTSSTITFTPSLPNTAYSVNFMSQGNDGRQWSLVTGSKTLSSFRINTNSNVPLSASVMWMMITHTQ
jgi:hypothetical protein